MANTFTQIYIQIVFTVKNRACLISPNHREELQRFISGIVTNRDQKLLAIFCMPDHVHLLVGIKPSLSISNLVRDIKAGSSKFVNDRKWVKGKFGWQEGFGAFSYSRSHISKVIEYIDNQENHHKKWSFREEYIRLLKKFEIEFDNKYLFDWIE